MKVKWFLLSNFLNNYNLEVVALQGQLKVKSLHVVFIRCSLIHLFLHLFGDLPRWRHQRLGKRDVCGWTVQSEQTGIVLLPAGQQPGPRSSGHVSNSPLQPPTPVAPIGPAAASAMMDSCCLQSDSDGTDKTTTRVLWGEGGDWKVTLPKKEEKKWKRHCGE